MADKTSISWTGSTWNPVIGCSPVSEGCANCYAEAMARRFAGRPGWGSKKDPFAVKLFPDRLGLPLRWRKPKMVFVCSCGDLFHPDVPFSYIAAVFGIMAAASEHTFQVLTKRPERMAEFFEWLAEEVDDTPAELFPNFMALSRQNRRAYWLASQAIARGVRHHPVMLASLVDRAGWPLSNIWLGVTAENQARADERIPTLLQTPAAVRFVSVEPMLGAVDVGPYLVGQEEHGIAPGRPVGTCVGWTQPLDWVICGGESGPNARPMHPNWARSLRDQCRDAGVPFHFKQWGEWVAESHPAWRDPEHDPDWRWQIIENNDKYHTYTPVYRAGKKAAGHMLDGEEIREWPGEGESDG